MTYQVVEIESLEHYIQQITGFSDVCFYRGVNDLKYKLIPSAGRFGILDKKKQENFERELLNDFIRKAPIFIPNLPKNDLDWMILAQHHGIPTRLLDWSFNPLIALFFAAESDKNTDCAVYMCLKSSGALNPLSFDTIFSDLKFSQIIPNFTHQRYANQQSLFTLQSDPTIPCITRIQSLFIIRKDIKDRIRWKLRRLGITRSFIFPNLDSLAYDILEVNKLSFEIV